MRIFLLTLSVVTSIMNGVASADTEAEVHRKLESAIVCTSDPIQTVHTIVDSGSSFEAGYASYGFGDGVGYKSVVILNNPIIIAGSKAIAVVAETENSYFDFNGIVYARFAGDYKNAIARLKLKPVVKKADEGKGNERRVIYERRLKINIEGQSEKTCPMVITLTPLENKEFLLGCGWCNG